MSPLKEILRMTASDGCGQTPLDHDRARDKGTDSATVLAMMAYEQADAMIAARKAGPA